jgi:hypothetical protein
MQRFRQLGSNCLVHIIHLLTQTASCHGSLQMQRLRLQNARNKNTVFSRRNARAIRGNYSEFNGKTLNYEAT